MPVTKTAKRALKSSKNKEEVNKLIASNLDIAIRIAEDKKSQASVRNAISLADRAAKKNLIHKNKAARIKHKLSKLVKPKTKSSKASK